MLTGPSVPFGWLEGVSTCLEEVEVELSLGRELLVFALLIASVLGVFWVLSVTRHSPR